MSNDIKKAVILSANDDHSFFPFTRCIPREFLPIGEVPLIERIVDEISNLKVKEVIFLSPSEKKGIANYFRNLDKLSEENNEFKEKYNDFLVSELIQKKGSESGHMLLKTKEKIDEDPFALLFNDYIFFGKKSSIEQILAVYRTSQKQVIALREVTDEEVSSSFIVKTEKIANRFYKIKKIIKNPLPEEVDSRLALAGRYILTPVIFDYLKGMGTKATIVDALNDIISAGKTIYGHECDGSWFSVKNKEDYLLTQKRFLSQ